LNYFKNTPGRPPIGRQDLSVIFFLQICNEVPGEKKGGPVAPPRATSGRARPRARQGPVAPSAGDRGACRPPPLERPEYPPYIRSNPPSLLISARKFQQKSRKKERGEEKGSGEALSDSALVICGLVHLVYIFFYLSTTHLSRSNLSTGE